MIPVEPHAILPLIDLTCLDEQATDATIEQLCTKAITPLGAVAAVCVYPQFITLARRCLAGTEVSIATVVNFPYANDALPKVIADIEHAIALGANEIDVVIPYRLYLSNERTKAQDFLRACRAACTVKLKIILETGALQSPELVAAASADAIAANVDFIKTSTGKIATGATPEAAAIMLSAIQYARNQPDSDIQTGFKASGGIREIKQAENYLELARILLGKDWISPNTFRFGASGLLDEIVPNAYLPLSPGM